MFSAYFFGDDSCLLKINLRILWNDIYHEELSSKAWSM